MKVFTTLPDTPCSRQTADSGSEYIPQAKESMKSTRNVDLRSQAAYSLAEAARYLRVASATLRSWVVGRPYPRADGAGHFRPLIHPPSQHPPLLSFWNLIEAHVLRSLRTEHGVSIKDLREALSYAERTLRIERLLLSKELRTDAGRVFLERYGELIELSASGQLAMRRLFDEHLKRVEWDERQFPVRLYPFVSSELLSDRPIVIDANVAFGRPIVLRPGITTAAIADRIDAGEKVSELASDYGLTEAEIEQAILYERAA
ncbi:MAG TPA: DUF433 domain-containing protein [Thermoanaerobaculia bacterium]|nr:DUF433 domain-containing protein [Thermoanaerobaculia bacterium]